MAKMMDLMISLKAATMITKNKTKRQYLGFGPQRHLQITKYRSSSVALRGSSGLSDSDSDSGSSSGSSSTFFFGFLCFLIRLFRRSGLVKLVPYNGKRHLQQIRRQYIRKRFAELNRHDNKLELDCRFYSVELGPVRRNGSANAAVYVKYSEQQTVAPSSYGMNELIRMGRSYFPCT